jgi:NitT/TauT family transport system substrate-binding protein
MKSDKTMQSAAAQILSTRRRRLMAGAGAGVTLAALGASGRVGAAETTKVRIGYWPVAAGLPFYAAVDKGYFKEAGLDVEAIKFAGAQQVMEAMIAGRSDGSANGTGSANLAIGELASPGLFKIFCSNPSNAKYVLDEFLVQKDSPYKTIADLKGKKVGSGPGIQNVTLAKTVLERAGAVGATVVELPIATHVASLAAGQIEAVYTLEPTGTVGSMAGTTRILEAGVIAHYILGDPNAPWFGGSATLTTEFIKENPNTAKRFIAAYQRGIELVKKHPEEARPSLKGYTAIDGALTAQVPLADYKLSNEFTKYDIDMFQKFFDVFVDKGVFSSRVLVEPMLYKG